mgnify:CR=1 FL=1
MPMFRSFVPRKIQPWIYLFIAVTFQLSGGVYLGALNQMIGGMALMREDIFDVYVRQSRRYGYLLPLAVPHLSLIHI